MFGDFIISSTQIYDDRTNNAAITFVNSFSLGNLLPNKTNGFSSDKSPRRKCSRIRKAA